MIYLLVILIIIFIILICSSLKKHECIKCKQQKKDVKARTIELHRLSGYVEYIKNIYYCDECAKGKDIVEIYEERPEIKIEDDDDQPEIEKEEKIDDSKDLPVRNIDAAIFLAAHGTIAMQKNDMLGGLQNNYSFCSITAGYILGLYAYALENQLGKSRINEFLDGVSNRHKEVLSKSYSRDPDAINIELFDPNWIKETATSAYIWLSREANKCKIADIDEKTLSLYGLLYLRELCDGGDCDDEGFINTAINNIKIYHSVVCKQFSLVRFE